MRTQTTIANLKPIVARMGSAALISVVLFAGLAQAQTSPQTTFPFPQIAVGQNGDGSQYVTDVILTNISGSAATGTIVYKTDTGAPLTVNLTSLTTGQTVRGDTINFTIPATSTRIYEAQSNGALNSGWALISTEASAGGNGVAISGTAAFILQDESGFTLSSAGVGATGFVTQFETPTENRNPDLRTGLAVSNMATAPATITLNLYDSSGFLSRTTTRTLPAFGHFSAFADEIFGIARPFSLDIGILQVQSTQLMAGVALEFYGSSLTTFPIIATQVTSLVRGPGGIVHSLMLDAAARGKPVRID